jgi:hypothetical protein
LLVRRASRPAAFYLLSGVAFFLALVWAYWAAPYDEATYLSQSAFRVVGGLTGICMAALAHLAPRLAARDEPVVPADEPAGLVEAPGPHETVEPVKVGRARTPAGLLTFWRA